MDTYLSYRLGVEAFDRRDFRSAIRHLEQVLENEPTTLSAREYLARAHFHRAALGKAEREARTFLEQDPTNEYMLLLLIRSLERQNRHPEAALLRRRLAVMSGEDGHLATHTIAG